MFRKIISIAIVLVLILSLAGCASDSPKAAASKEPPQTTAPAAAPVSSTNTGSASNISSAAPASQTTTPAAAPAAPAEQKPVKQPEAKPQTTQSQSDGQKNTQTSAAANKMFGTSKIEFTLKNLDNIKCSSTNIFSANKLTMINFWGTMCIPCIDELAQLQALNDELQSQGFGVIGVVSDITPDEGREDAKAIIGKKGVSYINLIPDDQLNETFISKMTGMPVSIFVDSNGNIVGEILVGAKSKDEYKKAAEKILSTMK